MTHTYTTVHKDYEADTLEHAAAAMLRDPEIWVQVRVPLTGGEKGQPHGYMVESWSWDQQQHTLRVNFR
jgi:hypothetical protein